MRPRGELHKLWRGEQASNEAKRRRARRYFKLNYACQLCGEKATDRHHADGNPGNNDERNIMHLCRKCHMHIDGRAAMLPSRHVQKETVPIPCTVCGTLSKGTRKGRCHRCNEFFRRNGVERTSRDPVYSKLSQDDINKIIVLRAGGMFYQDIAVLMGLGRAYVTKVFKSKQSECHKKFHQEGEV